MGKYSEKIKMNEYLILEMKFWECHGYIKK